MISIEISWGIYQSILLTLIFDPMGRLKQIGSSETPCKFLTLGTGIEKSADEPI